MSYDGSSGVGRADERGGSHGGHTLGTKLRGLNLLTIYYHSSGKSDVSK